MKDEALSLVRDLSDPARRLNLLREYLQVCIMRSLHESEAFVNLSFVGGTALRFLFNLPRFSEDLDFTLENPDGYEPVQWMEKLKRDFSLSGFDPTVRWNDRKTVHVVWIRIAELLNDAGLADMREQKLSIKLEIDTRPPTGATTETEVINRHVLFAVRRHDMPSLMAGKVHALVTRKYPKGRDWYDLLWYRAKRPPVEPNLILLQNALDQTEGKGKCDAGRWMQHVGDRLQTLDVSKLREGVRPFLERPRDGDLLTVDGLRSALVP